jgi:hypothetical protein
MAAPLTADKREAEALPRGRLRLHVWTKSGEKAMVRGDT